LPTLYYAPGACSLASHLVLEEIGAPYEKKRVNLAQGEQRSEAYLKINPRSRVPALQLDSGEVLTENVAILPYLAKTHPKAKLLPSDPLAEARCLSLMAFFAASVHVAHAHVGRPERYALDEKAFPTVKEAGLKSFHTYLKEIDGLLAGKEFFFDHYTVCDPYGLVFYAWGVRRELPVKELKHYTAFRDRMLKRPAVQRAIEDEKIPI
jgi:glutathione S-transferase